MLDYLKLWIYDPHTINNVLSNSNLVKHFTSNEDAVLTGIWGKYKDWQIKTITAGCLQVAGSIHKYWNNGTNENDFYFTDVRRAIKNLCKEFNLNPSLVFVKNLEFGVNLQLSLDASKVIEQMICFNGDQPIRPYKNVPSCYFIEFEEWDYYFKVYDKGKQAREVWNLPATPNTLRMEVKGMNSRFLMTSANINTLADLMQKQNLQALGLKFAKIAKGIVFDDDTIQVKQLSRNEKKLYRQFSNPRSWKQNKGVVNSTFRNKVNQFKKVVDTVGSRNIYTTIGKAINSKIIELSKYRKLANFLPNYTLKTAKPHLCLSCGKDISRQHANSRFCSAKYVGEKAAKRCRNNDSNERNNWSRKINNLKCKGLLFDPMPFFVGRKGKKTA